MEQNTSIVLKWIRPGTDEYVKSLDLRDNVLRRPLGQVLDRDALAEEDAGLLTAWIEDDCVGTMVMIEYDPETVKMIQVAVDPSRQRQGIGKLMNAEFEQETQRRGYKRIYLHARKVALDFYEGLGYDAFGEEFI